MFTMSRDLSRDHCSAVDVFSHSTMHEMKISREQLVMQRVAQVN